MREEASNTRDQHLLPTCPQKVRADRITGISLIPILRAPSKATPGVREAMDLNPS